MTESTQTQTRANGRPKRIPLSRRSILAAAERPGFIRRWFIDSPGRIEAALAAGWVHVSGVENNTSDSKAQKESQLGSVVKQVVNRSTDALAHQAYLMEIEQEFYEEDQAAKQSEIDEQEKALYPEKTDSNYGSLDLKNNK